MHLKSFNARQTADYPLQLTQFKFPFSLECYKLFCIYKIRKVTKTKVFLKVKTRHALKHLIQTSPQKSTLLCWMICITPPKCLRKERRRNFYSRCSIVVVEMLCVSKYGKGRNISVTRLRCSANHNALDSQSEHTALFRTMSFVNINTLQKGGAERNENNVRFVENIVVFLPF